MAEPGSLPWMGANCASVTHPPEVLSARFHPSLRGPVELSPLRKSQILIEERDRAAILLLMVRLIRQASA